MNSQYFITFEEYDNKNPQKIVLYDNGIPVNDMNVSKKKHFNFPFRELHT